MSPLPAWLARQGDDRPVVARTAPHAGRKSKARGTRKISDHDVRCSLMMSPGGRGMGRRILVACASFGLIAASLLATTGAPAGAAPGTAATVPVGPYAVDMTNRENV